MNASHVIELLGIILGGLRKTLRSGGGGTKPYHLLPKCVGLLRTIERCRFELSGGIVVHDGHSIVGYVAEQLQVLRPNAQSSLGRGQPEARGWERPLGHASARARPAPCVRDAQVTPFAADAMVSYAMVLRDLELPPEAVSEMVSKMLRKLDELELTTIPSLVYQLLLLADSRGKQLVLRELNAHFEKLLAGCDEAHAQASQAGDAMDIVPTRQDTDQLHHIQGTVVLHIQFAVKQDQALGTAILKLVKAGEMPLGGFSLSLLLVLSRIPHFEDAVIACIVSAFQQALQMREWCAASPWLTRVSRSLPKLHPEKLLTEAVATSASAGYEQGVQSLVRLATSLIDAPLTAAQVNLAASAFAEGALEAIADDQRLPVSARLVLLGQRTLLDIFRQHSQVRGDVLEIVLTRIVSRASAAQQWVSFLLRLVQAQPLMVLEHTQHLKHLLEYVLHLPASIASPLLRSLLPLLQQRVELRDHLVLLLRKAMFNREEDMRLTAVHGFLLLLQASAARPAAEAASSRADAAGSGAVQFQLEVLGFIRRSFTQQASIRRALYSGLVPAFEQLPQLRESILELLVGQLRQYDLEEGEDDLGGSSGRAELPLRIAKCLAFVGEEGKPTVTEPLPQLLQAITHCVKIADAAAGRPSQQGSQGSQQHPASSSPALTALRARMDSIVSRFGACSLGALGLGEKVEMSQLTGAGKHNVASGRLLRASLEALVEWCIHCGEPADESSTPPPATAVSTAAADGGSPESLKRIFNLLHQLTELLDEKAKGKKGLSLAECDYTMSLEACEWSLRRTSAAGVAMRGHACHFERHMLRACRKRALELRSAGNAGAPELERVASCVRLLLELAPVCEAITGKEAASGRRDANPFTGVKEGKSKKGGGGKDGGGKKAEGGKESEGSRARSRLLLLLEAVEPMIALLCQQPSLSTLASALSVSGDEAAPPPAGLAGGVQQGLHSQLLEMTTRLITDESYAEADMSMRLAAAVSAVLPTDSLHDALEWTRGVCEQVEVSSTPLAKARAAPSTHLHPPRRTDGYVFHRATPHRPHHPHHPHPPFPSNSFLPTSFLPPHSSILCRRASPSSYC